MGSRRRGIHLADCESNISNDHAAIFVLDGGLRLLSWLGKLRVRHSLNAHNCISY